MNALRFNRRLLNLMSLISRILRVACVVGVSVLPFCLRAEAPLWWSQRGVLVPADPPNDYAAVNQGQLKNIAKQTMAEMDGQLAQFGGAGVAVHALVDGWSIPEAATNDYAAVNLGQLKLVAKPFYDQLRAIGYSAAYPWEASATPANDYAAANIGQVKKMFAFGNASPGNGQGPEFWGDDGLPLVPDKWRVQYFGNLSNPDGAPGADPDGDGLRNFQERLLGLNPVAYSTAGDLFSDGWKVAHGVDPHHTVVKDTAGTVVKLQVFTRLE